MSSAGNWRPENIPLPEPHLLGLGLSLILHRVRPARIRGGLTSRAVGTVLLSCGAGLAVSATRAAGTAELANPDRLVTAGPYAISRNPMYVGWTLAYVGCALLVHTAWPLVLLPGVAAAVHNGVIGEEQCLEDRFGAEYRTYADRVRRYI
jgi:protein-S-isoprenylcysteine O-methyltransferase Ste14